MLNHLTKGFLFYDIRQRIRKHIYAINKKPRRFIASLFLSKRIIVCLFTVFVYHSQALADYTIAAGVTEDPATTPALLNATGTISIYGTLAINSDVTFTSTAALNILVYGNSGQIYWYTNKTMGLPVGSTITYVNNPGVPSGLQPTSGSASQILEIGSIKYAAANDNSNNVVFSFSQLNSIGGTATINATTPALSVCSASSVSFSANEVLPSGTSYYIQWSSSNGGTFSNNNSTGATTTSLTGMATGQDTVLCSLFANSGGSYFYAVSTDTIILTVNVTPETPVASVVQPTCSVSTGTITITAPTGSGLNYSSDGSTYANSDGVFGGMVAGIYTITVKNSYGCISAGTSVTVNTQPATPAAPIISAGGPTSFCPGGSVTLTSGAGTTYLWSTSATTSAISPTASGSYTVKVTNAAGCQSASSAATVVTVNARPTGTLSGTSSICSGNSAMLTIAATGSGTISGTLSDGTAFTGTAPTIAISVSPSANKLYTINALNDGNCTSIASDKVGSVTITVTAQPSAAISYASPFCSNSGTGVVTLTGAAGGSFSSAGASVSSSTGAIDLVSTPAGTYTIAYNIAASGGCAAYSTNATAVINPNTWTGANNTDWNTAANWAGNGVSNTCPDVTILSGVPYQPILSSGTATIRNLFINSGASLTISNATLQISGTINNSGTLDAGNGTIEMNGSSAQTIPAGAFLNNSLHDLVISNTDAGGVSLSGALDIYGSLTYSGTGMKLVTNDNLTFKSTATGTAWLGNMTGNAITGKATVERFISGRQAWRFLSVPTNTSQIVREAWQEGAASTASNPVPGFGIQLSGAGGTAAGFDLYSPLPSMKTYDPATNTWIGIPGTSNAIKTAQGYMAFIRGDRTVTSVSAAPTQTVLRTKGDLYIGDQAPVVVAANKFTAVGNPYAAALDMRNITKAGLKDFFYVWDPKISGYYGYGGYQTFSNDGSGNYVVTPGGGSYEANGSVSNYIQSGLAFFVQATGSGGSITLKEAAKTTGSALASLAAALPSPRLRATLFGVNTDNSLYVSDGILINYADDYSNGIDDMDAIKSTNSSENLSVKTAGKLLIVERRHTITDNDTISLNLANVRAQKYRFEITADQLYQPGLSGFLEDNYLHIQTPLNVDGVTNYDFSVTGTAGSYAANRFSIIFQPAYILPLQITSITATERGKGIAVEWKAANQTDVKQYEVEKSADGNNFSKVAAIATNDNDIADYSWLDVAPVAGYNYYRVQYTDINGKTSYSQIVKVKMPLTNEPGITIFPNPIVNKTINLRLTNQPEGIYHIRITNQLKQTIFQKQIIHPAGSSLESIHLHHNLPQGSYLVEIISPDNDIKLIKVLK